MKTDKRIIFLVTIVLTGSIAVFSCKKDNNNNNTPSNNNPATDTEAPVITITAPTEMQMFNSGDSLFIKGTVTDASLHELEIELRDVSKDSVLYSAAPTVHDLKSYAIDLKTVLKVNDHTNAELNITAEDHSSNVAKKTVHLHIMP